LAELDPALFVLDAIPNMEAKLIDERAEAFVRKVRGARPRTPIVLVAARPYTNSWIRQSGRFQDEARKAAFRRAYERLVADGLTGLSYVAGEHLFGDDGEASMDSSHPSNLGFMRMADALEPVLRSLL
jgi:lysophospholipase L1-like esterase